MTMTLLKERGWSDDNDARAFLLSFRVSFVYYLSFFTLTLTLVRRSVIAT